MQTSRSDFSKTPANDNCDALAPLVMALFDGEASEAQTRLARAHLLVCRTCANRWLDWNRARDLLRVEPAPAPPLLLWRILMACRLAAFSRCAPLKNSVVQPAATRAPASLNTQILSRTTQAASHRPQPRRKDAWLLRVPSLAASALAISLMILQRDAFISPPDISKTSVPAAQPTKTAPRRAAKFSQSPISSSRARPTFAPSSAKTQPAMRRAPASSSASSSASSPADFSEAAAPSRSLVSPVRVSRRPEPNRVAPVFVADVDSDVDSDLNRTSRERSIGREIAFYTRSLTFLRPRLERMARVENPKNYIIAPRRTQLDAPEVASARPIIQPIGVAAKIRPARPRRAQFALLASGRAPHLRAARWKNGAASSEENAQWKSNREFDGAERESEQEFGSPDTAHLLRVSLPTSARSPLARGRLVADNSESENARVEEMRSVVEDFRATLASDEVSPDDERSG